MAPCERILRAALAIVFWYSLAKRFTTWTVAAAVDDKDVRALGQLSRRPA
jgi:hypothetical protein